MFILGRGLRKFLAASSTTMESLPLKELDFGLQKPTGPTVGVKIKFPLRIRNTCVERRNVITVVQRQAKSTVFTLGYNTHQLVFISTPQWLLDLEPAPKQLEASPPQLSCLQLESASLNQ